MPVLKIMLFCTSGKPMNRIYCDLKIVLVFVVLLTTVFPLKAQQPDSIFKKIEDFGEYLLYRNHDTNYITNYSNEVAIRIVAVNKYNYFRLHDRINNSSIRYRPVRDISLGMGVSYRWFALDLTFSLALGENSDFENTRSFDFQGRFYSSKQFISATIQYYQGYQMGSSGGLSNAVNENSKRREDLRTINFGLQYLFAFNYTRFSLKAPFVFNEVQKKSAGSPIVGASFGIFTMDADSSVVPPEIQDNFSPALYLQDLSILRVGIGFGYMYTFVLKKHFFITLGLIPGINVNSGDYYNTNREFITLNLHGKFSSMNSIGYNGRRVHAGVNYSIDAYFSRLEEKMFAEIGHGKFTLFLGYRFARKKSK
jgi:hypothetical protein